MVSERVGHAAVGIVLDPCSHEVLSIAWNAADVVASRICEPAGCSRRRHCRGSPKSRPSRLLHLCAPTRTLARRAPRPHHESGLFENDGEIRVAVRPRRSPCLGTEEQNSSRRGISRQFFNERCDCRVHRFMLAGRTGHRQGPFNPGCPTRTTAGNTGDVFAEQCTAAERATRSTRPD